MISVPSLMAWLWGLTQANLESPAALVLAALAIFLEVGAVRFPRWGSASPAFGCYLALAISPQLGAGWGFAVVAAGLGGVARVVAVGRGSPEWKLAEFLAAASPAFLALVCHQYWQENAWGPYLTLLFYLSTALTLPAQLAPDQGKAQKRASFRSAPYLGAAALVGLLMGNGPPSLVPAAALVLAALGKALRESVVSGAKTHDHSLFRARIDKREKWLDEMGHQLSATRSGLHRKEVSEKMQKSLEQAKTVEAVVKALMRQAERITSSQNLAVFLFQNEELMPEGAQGPDEERIRSASLLKVQEPVVLRAWHEGRSLLNLEPPGGERLAVSDRLGSALCIDGFGVLYVGAQKPLVNEQRQAELELLCGHAAVALDRALEGESKQRALEWVSREHRLLQRWTFRLNQLLECNRRLSAATDLSQLMEFLLEGTRQVVPYRAATLVAPRGLKLAGAGPKHPSALMPVVEAVLGSGRPLLIKRFDSTRFQAPDPSFVSLLAAALTVEQKPLGVLVLLGSQPSEFQREHQDVLTLMLDHAGAAATSLSLQNEILQASKMAAVGQMAAGVAHELNNPLGAVQLAVDAAADMLDFDPSGVPGKLDRANVALERARDIVAKLLYYSRHQVELERTELELEPLVRETLDQIGFLLEKTEVQMELEPGLRLEANREELAQVLTNLAANAADAVRESERQVLSVRLAREGELLKLVVGDSGPGFTEEVMARATEPFFTTKAVGKGTGLGLSISQRIVENHGGRLQLGRSALGGAEVTLEFPVS